MEFVLSIDVGTSHIKAALVTASGHIHGWKSTPTPAENGTENHFEIDPNAVFTTTCLLISRLIKDLGVSPEQVLALAVTGQRASVIPLAPDDTPSYACLSWRDTRGGPAMEVFAGRILESVFNQITGLPSSHLWSLAKILWLRTERPDVFRKTTRYALLHDYLLRRFGANAYFTDYSNASVTGLLDIDRLVWSQTILAELGIDERALSTLMQAGTRAGSLSSEAASACGLAPGCPLIVGGGDRACSALGMGAIDPGVAALCLGTAATIACPMTHPFLGRVTRGTFITAHVVRDRRLAEGLIISYGSFIRWVTELLGLRDSTELSLLAAGSRHRSNPAVCLPFIDGIGSPDFDFAARGAFCKLDSQHDRADIAYSALAGLALEVRRILDAGGVHGPGARLLVSGAGASHDGIIAEVLATFTNRKIVMVDAVGTTSLGVGWLAWQGIGHSWAIGGGMVHDTPVPPDDGLGSLSQAVYDDHCRAVEFVRGMSAGQNTIGGRLPALKPSIEPSLRRHEDYDRALAFAGIGLYRYRFDGRILFMDETMFQMFDLSSKYEGVAQVIGRNIDELLQYLEPKMYLRNLVRLHGRARNVEYHYRTLSGIEKWALHDSFIDRDPATGEEVIQVVVRDITEHKLAEEALHRAASQRLLLARVSARVMAQTDIQHILTTVAQASGELTEARISFSAYGYANGEFRFGAVSRANELESCPRAESTRLKSEDVCMALIYQNESVRKTDSRASRPSILAGARGRSLCIARVARSPASGYQR